MTKPPVKEIVKDPAWQKVRVSLLGQWSKIPDWACSQLRKYLGSISGTSNEKLRIVMNYLTGTGFRTGKISHPCISKLRNDISEEIKKRKQKEKW